MYNLNLLKALSSVKQLTIDHLNAFAASHYQCHCEPNRELTLAAKSSHIVYSPVIIFTTFGWVLFSPPFVCLSDIRIAQQLMVDFPAV